MSVTASSLRRTPLHERHVAAGARMVPFAGWEMPVQYEGVRQEHLAVRTGAGLFDVSHMGEIEVRGPGAFDFLQSVLTNDLARIECGGAQYALMCRDDGGVLDDLFTYWLDFERFLLVVNAANAASDFAWIAELAAGRDDVEVADRSAAYAMLALQGPRAVEVFAHTADAVAPPRFRWARSGVAGADALVCRTGYTGEDGVEVLLAPADAPAAWDALVAAGATLSGLAARDTLRLEVCYPLYGNDLSVARTPIEAGLGWACALGKDFHGAARMREQAERGTAQLLAPFVLTGPGIPRAGCPVLDSAGAEVGEVTSGTLSPCMEVGIGMAYVRSDMAQPGTEVVIDVRGRERPARIASKPLYEKGD